METLARDVAEGEHQRTRVEPVSETPPETRRLIVHLSDPHFGSIVRNGLAIDMHRFFDGENSVRLSTELVGEIERAASAGEYRPEDISIVVSGDLTYTASVAEFKLVEAFLEELCEELSLQRRQVVLVPGNHDVDWRLAAIDVTHRFDNYLTFVRGFYGRDLFAELFPQVAWDFDIATDGPLQTRSCFFRCMAHLPLSD